jgi:hypothetical protein
MNTTQKLSVAVGLVGLACLGVAAGPFADKDASTISEADSVATKLDQATYVLLVDSIFARGCVGSAGGWYGCMCPMLFASEYAGTFTLTPDYQTPPGHRAYDVAIEDWLVAFGEETFDITGEGYYDTWTDLEGNRWKTMTLDLCIYDEVITFFSGLLQGQPFAGSFPETISINLDNDAECWGYMTVLEAERLPTGDTETAPGSVAEVAAEELSRR